MTFAEAIALANDIDASSAAELISIGRFLPIAEITPASPWGCSVMPKGAEKASVVWSLADYVALFASSAIEPPKPLPVVPRPDAAHRRQPTLF